MNWWEDYAARSGRQPGTFGERIKRNGSSAKRASAMTGLPYPHARALCRWLRKGEVPTLPHPDAGEPHSPATVEPPVEPLDTPPGDYYYDEAAQTFFTPIQGAPKGHVITSMKRHKTIFRAYSSADGVPVSVNGICRLTGWRRPWVRQYLRAHGMTHDSLPFPAEEVLGRTDVDMLADMRQMRLASLHTKIERDKWRHLEEDAARWRNFEVTTLAPLLAALEGRKPVKVPRLKLRKARRAYAAFIGLTDFHWGKYSDPGENFTRYNRAIARQRLLDATRDLMEELSMRGRPDVIYVPIGSDFLHIDNQQGQTTSGTPQDSDGTFAELFVTGVDLLEEWIGMLRQAGPVELVLMSGNHDRAAGVMMLRCLESAYRDAPDVTVRKSRTPRTYIEYGKNQIALVHGDGVKKPTALAMHMAMEDAAAWARCPHKTVYTGHLHNEKTQAAQPGSDTAYNVTCRQLPSIAGTDRWHALNGFIGAPKALPMYLHERERGWRAQVSSPVAA